MNLHWLDQLARNRLNEIFALSAQRIEQRVPLAYLLGCCQFMGYEFLLEPGVVVPRSPIGYLIDGPEQPWLPKQVQAHFRFMQRQRLFGYCRSSQVSRCAGDIGRIRSRPPPHWLVRMYNCMP